MHPKDLLSLPNLFHRQFQHIVCCEGLEPLTQALRVVKNLSLGVFDCVSIPKLSVRNNRKQPVGIRESVREFFYQFTLNGHSL